MNAPRCDFACPHGAWCMLPRHHSNSTHLIESCNCGEAPIHRGEGAHGRVVVCQSLAEVTDDYTPREMRLIAERDAALSRAEIAEGNCALLRTAAQREIDALRAVNAKLHAERIEMDRHMGELRAQVTDLIDQLGKLGSR